MEDIKSKIEEMFTQPKQYEEVGQKDDDEIENEGVEEEVHEDGSDEQNIQDNSDGEGTSDEDHQEESEDEENQENEDEDESEHEREDDSSDEFEGLLETKKTRDLEANKPKSILTTKLSKKNKKLLRKKLSQILENGFVKRILYITFIILGIIGLTFDAINTALKYKNWNDVAVSSALSQLDFDDDYPSTTQSKSTLNHGFYDDVYKFETDDNVPSSSTMLSKTMEADYDTTLSNMKTTDHDIFSIPTASSETTETLIGTKAVQRIAILGERNSGTNMLANALQSCFPNLEISTSLSRNGILFQSSTLSQMQKQENILVIGVFLNVYDWVELMRMYPVHAPNHEHLTWQEFVSKPWSMDRPSDDKPIDISISHDGEESFKTSHYCQFKFRYKEVIPCLKSITESKSQHNTPIYELNLDGSGNPYKSIIQLRTDKIRNILSTEHWNNVNNLLTLHYEDLLSRDHHALLNMIQTIEVITDQGVSSSCNLEHTVWMTIDDLKVRTDYDGYREWLDRNVDWEVEGLIGYKKGDMINNGDKVPKDSKQNDETSFVSSTIDVEKDSNIENYETSLISSVIESTESNTEDEFSIAIIGERHTGTKWLYDKIVDCYPDIEVKHSFNRPGFLFQGGLTPSPASNKKTIIIALFIHPYIWIELMRRNPEYSPNHKNLNWLEFVTKPWASVDFTPPVFTKQCQYNFTSYDIVPCHPLSETDDTMYELDHGDTWHPYNSIVDLRSDKIKDFLSLGKDHTLIPIKFECLMEGFDHLLDHLTKILNIQSQCSVIENEYGENKHSFSFINLVEYLESDIGLHSSCVDYTPSFEVKEGYKDYTNWLDGHLDWEIENSLGYFKPEGKTETTKTSSVGNQEITTDTLSSLNHRSKPKTTATSFDKNQMTTIDSASMHDTSKSQVNDPSVPLTTMSQLPVESTTGPKLAWLLTYPNSSTLYTLKLVTKASNTVAATNYGNFYLDRDYESIPLYKDASGPYIWSSREINTGDVVRMPSSYVLTQTHCGSRCFNCPPEDYIESVDKFLKECLQAPKVTSRSKVTEGNPVEMHVTPDITKAIVNDSYDIGLVKKMIHVIKDPFNTVVSGFQHDYKTLILQHKYTTDDMEKLGFTFDAKGFQRYCKDKDERFQEEEKFAYGDIYGIEIYLLTKNVPCHSAFYKYVQWHNLAFELQEKLSIPSYVFRYEEYATELEGIVGELLEFLQLPFYDMNFLPFENDNSRDYYTNEQKIAITAFIDALATDQTWSYVCHYFSAC